jgi:hypothetical protein
MLKLFPVYYWSFLIIFALLRVVAGQYLHYHIHVLKADNKYMSLLSAVESKQLQLFIRLNGVTHLLVLCGVVLMFHITYEYIVPITYISSSALSWVYAIGYAVLAIEFAGAVIATMISVYFYRSK